jgi:hypothetical protein
MACDEERRVPMNRAFRWLVKRSLQICALALTGILVALLVGLYAEYDEKYRLPSARWLALIPYTLVTFGATIREFQRSWVRPTFWFSVIGLISAHLAIYTGILFAVDDWRLIWFVPATMCEVPALVFILASLGYDKKVRAEKA